MRMLLYDLLSQLQRAKKQHAVIMQLFTMDYKQGVSECFDR